MNQIGRYKIDVVLEAETTGLSRYRAHDCDDGTQVLVKLVHHRSTPEEFRRMSNELRAMHHTESRHVVPLLDAGRHDGQLYTVIPWYPAGTLADAEPRDLDALRALVDASYGVDDLHEAGIIHRDIRPSSVIRSDGGGLIGELGLVALMWPGMATTGFGPVGSFDFTDPQLLLGQPAGRHSDIWALGAVAHAVATGARLHPDAPRHNAAAAILTVARERPVIDESCAPPIAAVIEHALAADPADRLATARDFASALEQAIETTTHQPSNK